MSPFQRSSNGQKRPSNGVPTLLPTVFQRTSNRFQRGVFQPPYTPKALEAAFSGAWGPLSGSHASRGEASND